MDDLAISYHGTWELASIRVTDDSRQGKSLMFLEVVLNRNHLSISDVGHEPELRK